VEYLVVVERAVGNHSACSPELPGCVATGPTPGETRQKMQEAIEMHLQGLNEPHLPVPEPSPSPLPSKSLDPV